MSGQDGLGRGEWTGSVSVPLLEHEEMGRWKSLPVWAQQELEHWRVTEAFERGRAESALAHVERLKDDRASVLREALDAVPQDICTHDGCDEGTCPLTRVNVAISALLDK